jgi:two-component system heavy metal sensor histidine kinase CusS
MSSSTGADRAARPRPSIAARLAALYSISSAVLLVAFALSMHWVLRQDVEQDEANILADEMRIVRMIIEQAGDEQERLEELEEEVAQRGAVHSFARLLVRVEDGEGRIVVETPGMAEELGPEAFDGRRARLDGATGIPYLIGTEREGRWVVRAALDVSKDETLIGVHLWRVLLAAALGVLVSLVVGVVIARRGVRPVARMASLARRVSASSLGERMGGTGWPGELVSLAAAFDGMLDRLQESFGRLSRFSADLAHELRTPVSNVMGESEVALSRPRSAEEYREALESNLRQMQKLSGVIESLLFLARAEDPATRVQRTRLDAAAEVAGVCEYHGLVAQERGVRLEHEGDAPVFADRDMLRRALSNLVSNAVKHTDAGGTVTVTVSRGDGGALFEVRDTGSGIDPEHLPRLFDRFFRSDPARSSHPDGTGLGLSIVKSIVDLHGGTIAVESEPGAGTRVTMVLPG